MTPTTGENGAAPASRSTFFLFQGSPDLLTWTYQGKVEARDRAHALNLRWPKATRVELERAHRVAVSESGWRPEEFGGPLPVMPDLPVEAPAAA